MIEIVEGSAQDIAAIMPVMHGAFDAEFGEAWTAAQCLAALTISGSQLLLARTPDGRTAGFAITRWVLDEEELLMIGVEKPAQKKNIASLLFEEIEHRAKSAGREKIFLEVREDNSAKEFYLKLGFLSIGRRKDYYFGRDGKRRDAITMQKFM